MQLHRQCAAWYQPTLILAGSLCFLLGFYLGDVRIYFPGTALITAGLFTSYREKESARVMTTLGVTALICFFMTPDLSDDFHRYLWEGHVQNQGFSPYQHSPQDLYDVLEHPSERLVNNDHLPAIYPPLAQYLFRISDLLTPHIWGWKLVLLLWCLAWLIPIARSKPYTILLIPAVAVEGWWNGHLDLAGLLPCILLLEASAKNKSWLAGLAMGALIALKTMPVLWCPFLFFHFKGRHRLWFTLWTCMVVLICYAPFLSQGIDLFYSFITFSKTWFFNNIFFVTLSHFTSDQIARTILTILFGLTYAAIFFSKLSVSQKCLASWMGLIICSPTFFPWYLLWLLPFLPRDKWAIFNVTYAAAFLSYWVLVEFRQSGLWQESLFWLIPEWLILIPCFYAMLKPLKTFASREESLQGTTT